jgi:hypothetical protein
VAEARACNRGARLSAPAGLYSRNASCSFAVRQDPASNLEGDFAVDAGQLGILIG